MAKRKIPVAWLATRECPYHHAVRKRCESCVPPDIEAHRECEQYRAPIHPDIAALLGIESDVLVLMRRIKLFVASRPVLTAISFVPDGLCGEPGDNWKDVAVDDLAVTGGHTLISWGYTASLNGLPATPDCITNGLPLDTELPVTSYVKPFKVWIEHDKERACRAGLILLVRRDLVRLEVGKPYPRLVLRKTTAQSWAWCRSQRGERDD